MLTHIIRLGLAHSLKPLKFKPVTKTAFKALPKFCTNSLGLYIHIPFCQQLCDFCPYNKELYNQDLMKKYIDAILQELEIKLKKLPDNTILESIYFGGGSPALAAPYLKRLILVIQKYINLPSSIGIELHPDNIDKKTLGIIKDAGITMVCVGVQSFSDKSLKLLNRKSLEIKQKMQLIQEHNFEVVDVDIIFALPGQDTSTLKHDFRMAKQFGATQISTYPFISFSYAGKKRKQPNKSLQRKLLEELETLAQEEGFVRNSIWTFSTNPETRYSSVTRNNVLGFGASATSLYNRKFIINTFSIKEYIQSVSNGYSPESTEMIFNKRTRMLYWLFWSSYNLHISAKEFYYMFGKELQKIFRLPLAIAKSCSLISRVEDGYMLTGKGAELFHRIEQLYTHQYIDKTWRICRNDARPSAFNLY